MEDINPPSLPRLGHLEWLELLCKLIMAADIQDVCLTGGEALLNRHLFEIVETLRPLVDRLELNTNGLLVDQEHLDLFSRFDRVKISLDTLNLVKFDEVTGNRMRDGLPKVLSAIEVAIDSGTNVAINCVVTSETKNGVLEILEWAQTKPLTIQLLDFYYTDERRDYWQENFVPVDELFTIVSRIVGPLTVETPHNGCEYFQSGGTSTLPKVRIKSSFSATTRSSRCGSCPAYCQEGVYALRYSTRGFVTYCPSYVEGHGVALLPSMETLEIQDLLAKLLDEIRNASPVSGTFVELLRRRDLKPKLFEGGDPK
jgi:molybdenum cofactor biosynthesis enzyme MoaA